MLDNTQNSTCEFAEELVSYLYDEMNGADKSRFENHLEACEPCRDELAEFSLARASIQEWHDKEFMPLANPAIKIPYPQKSSRSWFVAVRELFTLSPAWMTASTAFAALAICAALFAVVVSSLRDDENVVQQTENNKVIPSPTTGNQNQNSNVSEANQDKQTPDNSPQPPVKNPTPKPVKTAVEPTKVVAKPQNATVKTVQPKTSEKIVKPPVKTPKQKVPGFVDEDDDDDSLTLLDLLEKIGTDDKDD